MRVPKEELFPTCLDPHEMPTMYVEGLSSGHSSGVLLVCLQDYRARKKQRLQKKLVEQLRSSVQQSQASLGGLGLGADLQTILSSFGGESVGPPIKGRA